jgi:RNA polymerase sigma-70 factor (ECF subfamily)
MTVEDGWKIGQGAWPDVHVTLSAFSVYVGERLEGSHASVPWSDLYLACACTLGDAKALRAFEDAFFPQIEPALKRVAPSIPSDEVGQLLRHKLFVAEPGKKPKIADYAGRGALRTWLRIIATRTALDLGASGGREIPIERDALDVMIGAGADPELDYLKQRYAAEFRAAFASAFASLAARDRTLLRYAFGRSMSIDVIGELYGVHRATAARWVVAAHEDLVKRLRKTMMDRLSVEPDEVQSILRLIESRIEVSFVRLLQEDSKR